MEDSSQEFSLVCRSDIVFCDPGDDVVLSCHLQPAISAASMEIKWQYRDDIICHYKDGQLTVSRGYEEKVSLSLQDLHNGNVSLTLRDVRSAQRGIYICEVINKWQSRKEYIFFHIRSEIFRLEAPDTISAVPGENVTLPVNLLPEISAVSMKIEWLKGRELIYEYKYGQRTANSPFENRVTLSQDLERGNLSLTLGNVQQSDSGDYTCRVSHDGSVTTTVVHLQVIDIKSDLTEIRNKHLLDALEQLDSECLSNKMVKTLQEALLHDYKKKKEKKKTDDPTLRRRSSMEGLPPQMEYTYGSELERYRMTVERNNRYFFSLYDPTARLVRSMEAIPQRSFLIAHPPRRSSSMEGIPPIMESRSPDTTAVSLIMGQEAPSTATPSEVQPGQRTSESVILQEEVMEPVTRQGPELTGSEQRLSLLRVQIMELERILDTLSDARRQTPERAEIRTSHSVSMSPPEAGRQTPERAGTSQSDESAAETQENVAARPPSTRPPSTRPPSIRPPSNRPPSIRPPSNRPPSIRPPSNRPPSTRPPSRRPERNEESCQIL